MRHIRASLLGKCFVIYKPSELHLAVLDACGPDARAELAAATVPISKTAMTEPATQMRR